MENAEAMLNKAKKDFVLRQIETPEVQKNFGPMLTYLKPTLLTLIDLHGSQVSFENLQQVFDIKVKIMHKKSSSIAATTRYPRFKNINATSAFFKPYIVLYVDGVAPENVDIEAFMNQTNEQENGNELVEFFENKKKNKKSNVSSDPDQLNVAYKFVHEVCHAVGFRNAQLFKNNLPQPLSAYGTIHAQDGILKLDTCGLLHEEFAVTENGRVSGYRNLTPKKVFRNLNEGVNEGLTIEVINSPNFLKYLQEQNLKTIPKQKGSIYKSQVATANIYKAMFGQELIDAHFGGESKIKNKDEVEFFGQFCDKLNEIQENIKVNADIVYLGQKHNKETDIEYGTRHLRKTFELFDHHVFDFLDTIDSFMRTNCATDSKDSFPQEYKNAINEFIQSFDTFFDYVTPLYEKAQLSSDKLHLWHFDTQTSKHKEQ